jgi:hypothetical protein
LSRPENIFPSVRFCMFEGILHQLRIETCHINSF